mgnify:CR=1 FL=1
MAAADVNIKHSVSFRRENFLWIHFVGMLDCENFSDSKSNFFQYYETYVNQLSAPPM